MSPLRTREAVAVPISSLPRTSPRYQLDVRESFCTARNTCKLCSARPNSCADSSLAIDDFLSVTILTLLRRVDEQHRRHEFAKRAYACVPRFSARYFSRRRSRRVSGPRQYAARLLQPCEQNL